MNAVGCFIFQGSFTVGVAERFKVIAHLEDGDFGVATFKLNFPDVPVHTVVEDWPLDELVGKVDLLYGNPPCAPFSPVGSTISKSRKDSGQWRGDPRLKCWDNLIRVTEVIRPAVFVGESVPRFYTAGWELSSSYAKRFLKLGYDVNFVLHDVKFLGGPQQRRRVFLVATKVKLDWYIPDLRIRTFRDAVAGLDDPGPYQEPYDEVAEMLHTLPQGEGLTGAFDKFYPRTFQRKHKLHHPRFAEHRIRMDSPTGTVFGNVFLHPTEPRFLGIREYQRLMGYPDGYRWSHTNIGRVMNEMVKAVTPFAARYAAHVVASGLTLNRKVRRPNKVIEVVRWAKSTRVVDHKMVPSETDITGRLP